VGAFKFALRRMHRHTPIQWTVSNRKAYYVKVTKPILLATLFVQFLFMPHPGEAQANPQKAESQSAGVPEVEAKRKNLQEYTDLLRRDVRQQKAEIMGAVLALGADEAAKFWPIYNEYDTQPTKLNNDRIENIKEYARTYSQLTDEEADELIQKALAYQNQRRELFAKTCERVKQAIGAIDAARFAQIEHQLLLIIDLQIASLLPIATES